MSKIVFVTGNSKKFAEASQVISNLKQQAIDLDEIQSLSLEDVISKKIQAARVHLSIKSIIVEDSGLYIKGMNGLPGVMSKWFLESIGCEGTYKLSTLFGSLAYAQITIGYSYFLDDQEVVKYFTGRVEGNIVSPRGKHGFGWDAVFEHKKLKQTYAEMELEKKIAISDRRLVLSQLSNYLVEKT